MRRAYTAAFFSCTTPRLSLSLANACWGARTLQGAGRGGIELQRAADCKGAARFEAEPIESCERMAGAAEEDDSAAECEIAGGRAIARGKSPAR
jgi:hypothetical protein